MVSNAYFSCCTIVLRVVDDAMVMYLTGDKDVIHAWKEDINSRW